MRRKCSHCGSDEEMPFTCRYCGQPHCSRHRLPENHDCSGLEDYKERLRDRGKLMAETPQVKVQREIEGEDRRGGGSSRAQRRAKDLLRQLQGRATWALLGAMVAVTATFWILEGTVGGDVSRHFVLGPDSLTLPWAYVTSVFSHAGFNHLLFNGLILFFFGPALEQRIGSRTFATFFLLTGIVAGIAQVALGYGLVEIGLETRVLGVLGASGAIMGILGALTLLAPDAKVLLMFLFPIPLWVLTVGLALFNVAGLLLGFFGTGANIAFLAHLVGLVIGLWVAHAHWRRPRGPSGETFMYT